MGFSYNTKLSLFISSNLFYLPIFDLLLKAALLIVCLLCYYLEYGGWLVDSESVGIVERLLFFSLSSSNFYSKILFFFYNKIFNSKAFKSYDY